MLFFGEMSVKGSIRRVVLSGVKHLRLLAGAILIALTLALGGCGGNDVQEEQQDVEEAQQRVEEEQKDVEEAEKDVEEEREHVHEAREEQ
jgi:uncharacterized protein HemX